MLPGDVGGSEHGVAASPDRDPEPVRRFGWLTANLREMGRWLVAKGVRSVALELTDVYWMLVFEVLQQQGLEVYLVNAQHTKNIPGRKSDVQECAFNHFIAENKPYPCRSTTSSTAYLLLTVCELLSRSIILPVSRSDSAVKLGEIAVCEMFSDAQPPMCFSQ
jgi:hypothetical protein